MTYPDDKPVVTIAPPPQTEPPGRPGEISRARKPVAIFVCHGMGQQVHFETIEDVVNALLKEQGRHEALRKDKLPLRRRLMAPPPRSNVKSRANLADLCGRGVLRGELTLGIEHKREVHIYEGYWAPLTEGKIGVWQVFGFLLGAARLGIWNCLRNKGFTRFMFKKKEIFGGWHFASLVLLASLTYMILLLLVGPVLLANAFTLTTVVSLLFGKASWISSSLFIGGTWYIARIELFLLVLGMATVVLPKLYQWLHRKALLLRMVGWVVRALCFLLAAAGLAGSGAVAGSAFVSLCRYALQNLSGHPPPALSLRLYLVRVPEAHFLHHALHTALWVVAGWLGIPDAYLRLGAVWIFAIVFGYFVRWFLVEFAGDVAIYTSSYKVSTFDEVRDRIRQTVLRDAIPIYSARTGGTGSPWLYDDIIVVGHSLGSVIAYDTLNSLIASDNALSQNLDAARRTRCLLTFGSPLDKTAFVFRTHSTATHEFREKAAEAVQPLIDDYVDRPARWINIWSPMDIISGRLRYYDDPNNEAGDTKRVENMWDRQAWVPFAAHTEYWQDALFAKELYDAIF